MAFGIYVHVPYCLQLCPYCDFAKYEVGKTLAPEAYTELVRKEIRSRAPDIGPRPTDTIYFGGGTPSLLEPKLILSLIDEVANAGFTLTGPEISLEIDPATVDDARLDSYLEMGITRFSVGAQSFNDKHLKRAGRKHSARDTIELLTLLAKRDVNYSFDLLFALPGQTLDEVNDDVSRALDFGPSHLSAYNLTVPEGHSMDAGRAPEGEQVDMFDLIERRLAEGGLLRYEISNFAKPGRESKHNSLYWTDQPYWGVGLSSHSYLPNLGEYGTRFSNPRSMKAYEKGLPRLILETKEIEQLKEHQALTDFLHTSLRPLSGLSENALRLKFPKRAARAIQSLEQLITFGWAEKTPLGWALTREGRLVSNLAFEKVTFLEGELS